MFTLPNQQAYIACQAASTTEIPGQSNPVRIQST